MSFKFCPECGFKFDKEYKFCPECGFALAGEEEKKPEPLFDFSDDTAKYADDKFGGFDEMLKKQEAEAKVKSAEKETELVKGTPKPKEEIKAEAEKLYKAEKYKEAFPLCLQLAEDGEALFQTRTGWCYFNGKGIEWSVREALKWQKAAARQGAPEDIYLYGAMCLSGEAVDELGENIIDEGIEWLEKAEAQGHKGAKELLDTIRNG